MLQFKNILFPCDFSAACQNCAPYVAKLAAFFESRVTILHAMPAYDGFGYGAISSTEVYGKYVAEIRNECKAELSRLAGEAFTGLDVTREYRVGEPADLITNYAKDHGIDLIVMPTHGHGLLRRFLLGSVTAKVLHDSPAPIWTAAHLESWNWSPLRRILCAVDFQAESTGLLQYAGSIADRTQAALDIVHGIAYPETGTVAESAPFPSHLAEAAREKMDLLIEKSGLRRSASEIRTYIELGDPVSVITDTAKKLDSQLLITGRGHARARLGSLFSRVNEIVREATCPVLSFAIPAATDEEERLRVRELASA